MLKDIKKRMNDLTNEVVQFIASKNEIQGAFLTRAKTLTYIGLFIFGWIFVYTFFKLFLDWDYILFMNGTSVFDNLITLFLSKFFQLVTLIVSFELVQIFFKSIRKMKNNNKNKK